MIIDSGGGYGSNVSKTLMLRRHLSTGSSRDSGFTSQDTLNRQPTEQVIRVSYLNISMCLILFFYACRLLSPTPAPFKLFIYLI